MKLSNIVTYLDINKSEAMVIGQPVSQDIQVKCKLKWEQSKLKYLGVIIPKELNKILDYNFGKLENNLKQDLQRWSIIPRSITERIETIKMNVLPRFAFLFQNLPIFIPQNIFVKWDKLLSTFIWGQIYRIIEGEGRGESFD